MNDDAENAYAQSVYMLKFMGVEVKTAQNIAMKIGNDAVVEKVCRRATEDKKQPGWIVNTCDSLSKGWKPPAWMGKSADKPLPAVDIEGVKPYDPNLTMTICEQIAAGIITVEDDKKGNPVAWWRDGNRHVFGEKAEAMRRALNPQLAKETA